MNKVLLINDSKFESIILKDALEHIGYTTYITNEFRAITDLNLENPDIVIVNYVLQEMYGDELIERMKQMKPSVICILSSNNPLKKNELRYKEIDGFFQTPVSAQTLKTALNSATQKDEFPVFEPDDTEQRPIIRFSKTPKGLDQIENIEQTNQIDKIQQTECTHTFRFCPNCGEKLNDVLHIKFCPFCGDKLG